MNRDKVKQFHLASGQTISETPYDRIFLERPDIVLLRYQLIKEEVDELSVAIEKNDFIEILDALMDILYVLYGAAITYGAHTITNTFDNYIKSIHDHKISSKSIKKVLSNRFKIELVSLREELELYHCAKSISEIERLLNNMIIRVYTMCLLQNIDADYCFNLVHVSNMSKFCKSETVAKETIEWYKKQKNTPYDSPAYYYNENTKLWVVFNKSTGKVLKSHLYHPVDFHGYLEKN